ncbi:MAG: hypothetical protein AB1758_33180, partial [Candidatus Eremiobacterota bacterium]
LGRLGRLAVAAANRRTQARVLRLRAQEEERAAQGRVARARAELDGLEPMAEEARLEADAERARAEFEQAQKEVASYLDRFEGDMDESQREAWAAARARYAAAQEARDRADRRLQQHRVSHPQAGRKVTRAEIDGAHRRLQAAEREVADAAARAAAQREEDRLAERELRAALDGLPSAVRALEAASEKRRRAVRSLRTDLDPRVDEHERKCLDYFWEVLEESEDDYIQQVRNLQELAAEVTEERIEQLHYRVRKARSRLGQSVRDWWDRVAVARERAEAFSEERAVAARREAEAQAVREAEERAEQSWKRRFWALYEFLVYLDRNGGSQDAEGLASMLTRASRTPSLPGWRVPVESKLDILKRVAQDAWSGEVQPGSLVGVPQGGGGWNRSYRGPAAAQPSWFLGTMTAFGLQQLYGYFAMELADRITAVSLRELDRYGARLAWEDMRLSGREADVWVADEGEGAAARLMLLEPDGSLLLLTWGSGTGLRAQRVSNP